MNLVVSYFAIEANQRETGDGDLVDFSIKPKTRHTCKNDIFPTILLTLITVFYQEQEQLFNKGKYHHQQVMLLNNIKSLYIPLRTISTGCMQCKNRKAGIVKSSRYKNIPLTYEQAQAPYQIGVNKSWNSWNTSSLYEEGRAAETNFEDMVIRKFIYGTWYNLFLSEVIIKRRHNTIYLAGLVSRVLFPTKLYFLIGYTEEMLAHIFKCPVKLEIQTVNSKKDVIFKHV